MATDDDIKAFKKTADAAGFSSTEAVPVLWISSLPSAGGEPLRPRDLPDVAAAAYFKSLGRVTKDSSEFIKAAGTPIGEQRRPAKDTTSLDRTLIITVSRQEFQPASRLIRTKLTLTPKSGFSFTDYTIAATTYGNVNIADITQASTVSVGAELAPTLSGTLVGAGKLSRSRSNSVSEETKLAQQFEQQTVWFEGEDLVIYRESERGLDLTGTTLVKLSLKVLKENEDKTEYFYYATKYDISDDKGLLDAAAAKLTVDQGKAAPKQDYEVKAKLDYVLRETYQGADSYSESDDVVRFVKKTGTEKVFTAVKGVELEIPRWIVGTDSGFIEVDTGVGFVQLNFLDFTEAQEFAIWMVRKKVGTVGATALQFVPYSDMEHPQSLASMKNYPGLIVIPVSGESFKKPTSVRVPVK